MLPGPDAVAAWWRLATSAPSDLASLLLLLLHTNGAVAVINFGLICLPQLVKGPRVGGKGAAVSQLGKFALSCRPKTRGPDAGARELGDSIQRSEPCRRLLDIVTPKACTSTATIKSVSCASGGSAGLFVSGVIIIQPRAGADLMGADWSAHLGRVTFSSDVIARMDLGGQSLDSMMLSDSLLDCRNRTDRFDWRPRAMRVSDKMIHLESLQASANL